MAQFAVPPTMPSPRRPADIAASAPRASPLARALRNRLFLALCLAATGLAVLTLVVLLATIWREGSGSLSWDFLGRFASRQAADARVGEHPSQLVEGLELPLAGHRQAGLGGMGLRQQGQHQHQVQQGDRHRHLQRQVQRSFRQHASEEGPQHIAQAEGHPHQAEGAGAGFR